MTAWVAIRSARRRRKAEEWALVLASQGVASRVEQAEGAWQLAVGEEHAADAHRALDAFDEENAPLPPEPEPPPEHGPTAAGFLITAGLILFFGVTGPRDPDVLWFARGSARAVLILDGEIWRTVTALTLHADLTHLFGNAISCALFGTAVCRVYGPGFGGALILLAGTGGNLLNALYRVAHHSSVGASTALFGAIGILAGTQFVRRHSRPTQRPRAWLPLAGGLALLAMLGTGERSDLMAHVFGLGVGGLLGVAAGYGDREPPPRWAQLLLGSSALLAVGLAWSVALGTWPLAG